MVVSLIRVASQAPYWQPLLEADLSRLSALTMALTRDLQLGWNVSVQPRRLISVIGSGPGKTGRYPILLNLDKVIRQG